MITGLSIKQVADLDKYGHASAALIEQAGLNLPNVGQTNNATTLRAMSQTGLHGARKKDYF